MVSVRKMRCNFMQLAGLLSADAKSRLVYWRYGHPLPCSHAFSEHLRKETRADPGRLVEQWGPLPTAPDQQKRLWYRIYKSTDHEIRVHEAYRAWLFSRDLAAYTRQLQKIFIGESVQPNIHAVSWPMWHVVQVHHL